MPPPSTYKQAGVNIVAAENALDGVRSVLNKATRPEVLGSIGGFGGLFALRAGRYHSPVLVSSIDGVGTKLKLASSVGDHQGIGYDLVNHCLNDIAVMGAEPLYFLDYIGMGKLDPKRFQVVLRSIANACRRAQVALIGGETAEMPGCYPDNDYDLVGAIVGVAEKQSILNGKPIRPGDRVIGLASKGLHTNGYSLVRQIIRDWPKQMLDKPVPGACTPLAKALLQPHRSYLPVLRDLLELNRGSSASYRKGNTIFAAAHITGGGLPGNLARVLPKSCDAAIDTGTWRVPALFQFLSEQGELTFDECYRVFNMGIGLALVTNPEQADVVIKRCRSLKCPAWDIGAITSGNGKVLLQ